MFCHRCNDVFDNKDTLLEHWKSNSKIPCDFICGECGTKLHNQRAFYRHQKSRCQYKPKGKTLDSLLEVNKLGNRSIDKQLTTTESVKTVNNINNTNNTNTNCNNTTTNNININIERLVITPHTHEMKVDKEQLLGDIVEKILFRMDTGLSGKANWGTMAFTDSFHQMFAHIYGNKQRPEYHNLLLKDEATRELQVFNGQEFVDDKLTSEERMLKVLNFMGDGLRWMVENCDNYTDEEKEAKSEKIGRVLSGIPRFKMTYKAMFDNIFNTLKDVREQILERIQETTQIQSIEN